MENNIKKEDRIRTFGRVKGRAFNDTQQYRFDNVLPKISIKIEGNKVLNYPKNSKKTIFEIGFGHGEQLANQAILHPDYNLIGCETYINGVLSLIDKIEKNNIKNIRIFPDDARILLEKIEDCSIDVFFIFFPDPWPKRKQKRRRIITEEFLLLLNSKLKNNGVFFFASDIDDYVEYTNNLAIKIFKPCFRNIEECKKEPNWWVKTTYQNKAIKEARECYFLEFKK